MGKGKVIWLSDYESVLFEEARETFSLLTGAKISRGAFICAISLGASAAKSLTGIKVRCPDCGREVVMELHNPKKNKAIVRSSVSHSQTPRASA
jgi:hypothetical protein